MDSLVAWDQAYVGRKIDEVSMQYLNSLASIDV